LDGHLLECKVTIATDAQAKSTEVVFDAERFRTTLAVNLPLWGVIALLAEVAWAR
jgi:hypothetical protein